jgi:hypothetical protein
MVSMRASQVNEREDGRPDVRPRPGIGFGLVSAVLLGIQPLGFALSASAALPAIAIRGPAVAAILALKLIVAAAGFGAGLALVGGRPGAVRLAVGALAASAATDTLVYLTPWFPSNRMPGDTPFYLAASWICYGGLLMYLVCSRRVREIES